MQSNFHVQPNYSVEVVFWLCSVLVVVATVYPNWPEIIVLVNIVTNQTVLYKSALTKLILTRLLTICLLVTIIVRVQL